MKNNDIIYELLNEHIEGFLKEHANDISEFKVTSELGKLILSLNLEHPLFNDIEGLDVTEINPLLEAFFKSISPELLDTYLNIRSDKSIRFISASDIIEKKAFVSNNYDLLSEEAKEAYLRDSSLNKPGLDKDGNLTIILRGTLDDLFITAHEFMHKIFYQKLGDKDSFNNLNFLVEVVSMTIEVMLTDYLISNDLYKESALKYKYNTLKLVEQAIYHFLMQIMLIEIYMEYGGITEENIKEYISKLEEPFKSTFIKDINKCIALIIGQGLDIWYFNRYIFAVFVSYYLKDIYKNDIEAMFKLGRDIYDNNFIESLKRNKLDLIEVTNIISRLLGQEKYKPNSSKINELYMIMKRENEECLNALNDVQAKR